MGKRTADTKEGDRPGRLRARGSGVALPTGAAGLTSQARTLHLTAKVQPALFEAAARRVGSRSPTIVIEAALVALAVQDDLGPWLAEQWGILADVDPEILAAMEF